MRLPDALRSRLRGPAARLRGFRGHLDGEIGGALVGWVQLVPARRPVRVGLYVKGALLAQAPAHAYRGDVAALGYSSGHGGFVLLLTDEIRDMVAANGGLAEVRVMCPRAHVLGHWRPAPPATAPHAAPLGPDRAPLARRLYADLTRLAHRLAAPAPPAWAPRPTPPAQSRMFGTQDYLNGGDLPAPLFAYAEFLRLRDRLDTRFNPARIPEDIPRFLAHYLSDYSATRGGLRIPLSAAAIAWLNAPAAPTMTDDRPCGLSRAARLFSGDGAETTGAETNSALDRLYQWAAGQAWALHCEDCLVAPDHIAALSALSEGAAVQPWGLSEFLLRLRAETAELIPLPIDTEKGRRDLTCAVLILALSRPDFLRYIPPASIDAALSGGVLADFCASMGTPLPRLDRAGYAHALRAAGFDLDRMCFTSLTAEGHRAEFARFAPPDGAPANSPANALVEIQIIGPFGKASGLGQATRLSALMLERAGYHVHRVDFTLDNPSPEDAARARALADLRPARVNLWHINVEALPLAAAYLPDVFSGSYNIAYPFWELDSPGACHPLGIDLVDELWVAPQFGVDVFQPHTDKPVTAVGMSYEDLPDIPRAPARARLEARIGAAPEDFTFLVTFDSFSFLMRKNALGVVEAFSRAFPKDAPGGPPVRLVLKTQNRARVADPAQAALWHRIDAALQADPRITMIDETLPYAEVLQLKKGADAYVSLHRSEGWGFGMIEAMNLGLPVLATAYSGNMDFCDADTCWLVDYTLTEVGPQDYIFVRPGQMWAEPDLDHAAAQMRALYHDPDTRAARTTAALDRVRRDFSQEAIAARYGARMRAILDRLGAAAT
ncbi:glycosyl transferases group 1 (plasmid) [Antarctobacter heliothermus]|uniref:Glycosyl transferases group 1 n=1 Tax=Antarctobacter heliothermus TaxID=74033 RepID=A0A222EBK3_9RHOB|nr:glycosyltransferase [Antarctobacter heliothermus]ASP23574.1 glycosyl transferases group 1 [Antarctobacter heliothermus]